MKLRPSGILILLLLTLTACQPAPTPQPTVTQTVALPAATATMQPKLTPKPTATVEPPILIELAPPAIWVHQWGGGIGLYSLSTGNHYWLEEQGVGINAIYDWEIQSCTYIARLYDGSLVKVDLQGELTEILVEDEAMLSPGGNEVFDPGMQHLAYTVGTGYQSYDRHEFQNIFTIRLDDPGINYPITTRGGSWNPAWSPDGKLIAHSDYDISGRLQVFVSNPIGENRTMLTNFDGEYNEHRQMLWSPNGDLIAVDLREIDEYEAVQNQALGIVSDSGTEILTGFSRFFDFWWETEDTLVVEGYLKSANAWGLHWLDVWQRKVRFSLLDSESPVGDIYLPKAMDDQNHIGFFTTYLVTPGDDWFYVYDKLSGSIEVYPAAVEYFGASDWGYIPDDFLSSCNP